MSSIHLDESILYSTECRKDFSNTAAELVSEFQPTNQQENEILEHMLAAEWLKRRYVKVRTRLYDRKRALPSNAAEAQAIVTSIEHFQTEVESQKKHLANMRKSLRRLRAGQTSHWERQDEDALLAA